MFVNKKVIIFIVIILYILPRYHALWLTLPVYKNSEADVVFEITETRTASQKQLFFDTDLGTENAFLPLVPETPEELRKMTREHVLLILGLKYLINRPRPQQIRRDISVLPSRTASTPSMPSGHAFQAYYLSKVLSKKYPELTDTLEKVAADCARARVWAGVHYPSDGALSKWLVENLL